MTPLMSRGTWRAWGVLAAPAPTVEVPRARIYRERQCFVFIKINIMVSRGRAQEKKGTFVFRLSFARLGENKRG